MADAIGSANEGRSMQEKYPALKFLMRHIDDVPNVSHSRYLQEVVEQAAQTSLGLALAGEVAAATRIIEALRRTHSLDLLADRLWATAGPEYPFLKPCMYFAWEATSSWPDWVPAEERTEERLQQLEDDGRQPWLERFSEPWSVDPETAEKAKQMASSTINKTFPNVSDTDVIVLTEKWFQEGQYPFAANPNGPISLRYSTIAMLWRDGTYPIPFMQLYRSAGLMIALDIYLRLGNDDESARLFQEVCDRFTFYEQAEMLACSRPAWQKLLTRADAPLLTALEIHPAKLRPAATRAVKMFETRLTEGPARPFKDRSIEQLVHLISAHTFEHCPYDAFACYGVARDRPRDKDGLLRPPCPASTITELEKRLGTDLPDEYKEFLSVTNGMEPFWNGGPMLELFADADSVQWVDIGYMTVTVVSILRNEDPPVGSPNSVDWPKFPRKAVSLSGGAGTSHLWLLDRDTTAECKRRFFEAYEGRDDEKRRELERVVAETYDSMDNFQRLDRALVTWRDWALEVVPYNGIRGLLETMALQSMRTYQFWLGIFEPGKRMVSAVGDGSARVD